MKHTNFLKANDHIEHAICNIAWVILQAILYKIHLNI